MTNKEAIIEGLQANTYEADVCTVSYIACPYYSDSDCKNPYKSETTDHQLFCDSCKIEWLYKDFES